MESLSQFLSAFIRLGISSSVWSYILKQVLNRTLSHSCVCLQKRRRDIFRGALLLPFFGLYRVEVKRIFVLFSALLVMLGCSFRATTHDPIKAASDGGEFLLSVYINHDYVGALRSSHNQLQQSAKADDLQRLVEQAQSKVGTLQKLTGESFVPVPGDAIEVFFVGRHERGILYNRLVLIGDSTNGYKVSGFWFSSQPYSKVREQKSFSTKIEIR